MNTDIGASDYKEGDYDQINIIVSYSSRILLKKRSGMRHVVALSTVAE